MRSKFLYVVLFFTINVYAPLKAVGRSFFVNQLLQNDAATESENTEDEGLNVKNVKQTTKQKNPRIKKKSHNQYSVLRVLQMIVRKTAKGVAYCGGLTLWRKVLPRVINKRSVFGALTGSECVSFGFGVLILLAAYEELFQERHLLNLPDRMQEVTHLLSAFPISMFSLSSGGEQRKDKNTWNDVRAEDASSIGYLDGKKETSSVAQQIAYDEYEGYLGIPLPYTPSV